MPTANPFDDPAKPLLDSAARLTNAEKADAWDAWHTSPSVSILARKLVDLETKPDLAQKLCVAKAESLPQPTDVEKVHAILRHMSTMNPRVLDIAEKHPHVLHHLTAAGKD